MEAMSYLDRRFQQLKWEYINFSMELMYRKQMELAGIEEDEIEGEVAFMLQAKSEFQLAMGGSLGPTEGEEERASENKGENKNEGEAD